MNEFLNLADPCSSSVKESLRAFPQGVAVMTNSRGRVKCCRPAGILGQMAVVPISGVASSPLVSLPGAWEPRGGHAFPHRSNDHFGWLQGWLCMCVLDNLSTLGLLAARVWGEWREGGKKQESQRPPGAKNHLDDSPPRFLGRGEHPDIRQPVGAIIHAWILRLGKGMDGDWLEECFLTSSSSFSGFSGDSVVKNLPANVGDVGSIPGLGRSHLLRSN